MNSAHQSSHKEIIIVKGTGSGTTELAAYDSALLVCGIGNYNLIRLSSVIPPSARIVHTDVLAATYGDWGDKLYVVYAEAYATVPNEQAWAGIGWVVLDEDGAGLFVEHGADSEEECRRLLKATLSDLCTSRGHALEDYVHDYEVIGAVCEDKPVCAIIAAVYDAEGWGQS